MKYIINRETYLMERIVWLDNKQEGWDKNFTKLIMSFHDTINEMIEELKDKFNDKDDPDAVFEMYMEYLEKAFDNLTEEMRSVDDDDQLYKLWNELVLNFSLWKDSFSKMSEKLDNYNSIFKLGFELFEKINMYITKGISKEYYDGLKGEIDDKRQNSITFVEKFFDEIKIRLDDINPEDVFSMSNLDEKEVDDLALNAGDEVRYYKTDDEENVALISHNQEELQEVDNIRLVAKTDGTAFEIDKSELIEILPKHKTTNQEVSDKLKKVKTDPDKLDKLNDFLDELAPDEDEVNESTEVKEVSKKKPKSKPIVKVSDRHTKIWINNHQFKRIHVKQIGIILRDVYKPTGHWRKHQFWGVMNLPWEDVQWSILNKISTNHTALPVLINELNRSIKDSNLNVPEFIFTDKQFTSQKFYDEYYRMMNFIKTHKEKVFLKLDSNSGGRILNRIIKRLQETSGVGDSAEGLVVEHLPSIFSSNKIDNIDTPMGDDVDILFKLDGVSKTIKVIECKSILKSDSNKYLVLGAYVSKDYDVDFISCVSKHNITIFRYETNGIELLSNGDLKIQESLLSKNIKLNK
jgi:hypothetical protein